METFISDMKVVLTHATVNSPFGNKQNSSVQQVVFCYVGDYYIKVSRKQ